MGLLRYGARTKYICAGILRAIESGNGEDWFQERDGRSFLDALSRRRDAGLQSCFEWAGAIGLPFGDAPVFERDSREPVSKLAIRERTWRTLDGYHFVLRRPYREVRSRRRDAGLQSCFEWAGAIGLPFGDAPAFERDSREPVSKLAIRERTWRTLDGYHFVLRLVSFE